MSVTDPLADMIIRIRNGQTAGKREVSMQSSKLKVAVCKVLVDQGYLESYRVEGPEAKPILTIVLKYYNGVPVIAQLDKVSKSGRRIYRSRDSLPSVLGGFGIAIVSTSQGVMTDVEARAVGHGGEILCTVA